MSGRWREKILILYYTIYYSTVIEVRPHFSKTVKEFTIGNPGNACFLCLDAKIYQHMAYGKPSAYALSSYEILYKIEEMVLWFNFLHTKKKKQKKNKNKQKQTNKTNKQSVMIIYIRQSLLFFKCLVIE